MVTPEKLEDYSYNRVVDIYNKLSVDICSDIIERVSALGNITSTTRDELNVLLQINGQEIFEETLKKTTMLDSATRQELMKLYNEVAKENMKGYKPLYDYRDEEFKLTNKQIKLINKKIKENSKEIRNFTNSVAFNSKELFIESVDEAYLKVSSGAFSYDKAIEQSYKEIASTGLKMTDKAGRKVAIDVAVRRSVLTGLQRMVNGINYSIGKQLGCDGYEVSAHIGARPTHEICQGLQYAIDKDTAKEYGVDWWYDTRQVGKPIAELWEEPNCRHTVFPIIVGINEPTYTKKELEEINNTTTTLYGEEVPIYEANQEMRRIERNIREYQKQVDTLEKANIDNSKEKALLRKWKQEYAKVSKETDIPQNYDRIKTYSKVIGSSNKESKYKERATIRTSYDELKKINVINDDLIYKPYSKQTLSKIHQYESSIKILPVEKGAIIDRLGNVKVEFTGKEGELNIPNKYKSELMGNILTHTHFYNFTFSPEDLISLVQDNEYELRANTPSKIVYSLRRDEVKVDKVGFMKKYEKDDPCSDEKVDRKMKQLLKNKNTDYFRVDDFNNMRDNISNEFMDKWLTKNANEYGYIYSKEVRK